MTAAGDLDRRITVQRSTKSYNEYNDPVYTWTDLASVAAARADVSDTEKFAYGMTIATKLSRFTVRSSVALRDVKPSDRLVHEGAIGDIQGIKEAREGRRRFLEITAVFGG